MTRVGENGPVAARLAAADRNIPRGSEVLEQPEIGSPEYWAQLQPEAVAVVKGEQTLTYGEWDDRANRLADALAAAGLSAGDRLGMRFRLDIPWFVVQRALQKLGVVQVAVNWKLTPSEAAYILQDCGAKGLACDDRDVSDWGEQGLELLITVGQEPGADDTRLEDLLQAGEPVPRYGPLSPRMILYTSGTTGRPKGVPPMDPTAVADPARLERYLASVRTQPSYPAKPVVLMTLPVHHGGGPAIITKTCALGGTCVLLDPFDAEEALRLIEQHRVQVWSNVPTMLLRIQALPKSTVDRYDLSSIISMSTGAAPVPQSTKEWVVDRVGPDVLWESYGCSEAGPITRNSPADQLRRPGSSGLPFDEVEIAIVDDKWNRLPAGDTGEIAVRTPVLLSSYIGEGPLGEDTLKDGLYRTGDVGYLDEDGYLFITDRVKDMIVAGGVNIYPAEIERAIIDHLDIENCAVIGIPQDDFGEQPLAFVVPKVGRSVTPDDVLTFLDGRLASFKKPRRFEIVDELPTNTMGKVLKNELRKPYWEGRTRLV
jgi:long-chain acyl-CoA synthetase